MTGDLNALKRRLRSQKTAANNEAKKIVADAVKRGATYMVQTINTSGTGWVGKGPKAFAEGRVDYGHMRSDVSFETNGTSGKFGWVYNQQDYYLEQEFGFMNPRTGRMVPPMLALTTASARVKDELQVELRKKFK